MLTTTAALASILPVIDDAKLSDIDIPEGRARDFDADEAAALAAIIAKVGLQHPIRVRMVGNRFGLVAGRIRLEAARLLGWDRIPITVSKAETDDEARLEEVMENLGRPELKVLDRCHHLFELKQVHERVYPEAKHGGDRKSEIKRQKLPLEVGAGAPAEIFGFSAVAAEKIGLSDRTIRLAVKIWSDLSPASRARCAGTWLANHQAGLKQLAEQSEVDQVKVLDILLADPPKAANVPDALTILENGRVLTHVEKKVAAVNKTLKALPPAVAGNIAAAHGDARLAELQQSIATLSKFFAKLEDDELDTVVAEHEVRIIASLKRRGRI